MKFPIAIDMVEATRLTRQGKLKAALALLSRGAVPEAQSPTPDDGIVDMVAPSRETGAAWTPPADKPANRAPEAGSPLEGLMARLRDHLPGGVPPLQKTAPASPLPVARGASFETHLYTDAVGQRPYKLYIPSAVTEDNPALIAMLHGCTQSPDDFATGTQMNALAEAFGFLVVYPGQTQAANASKCWNWFNAGDQQRDRGEPALIAGLTRDLIRIHHIDPRRVFVAGLSAGGAAAAVLGAVYPDLYAAVGVHSGIACGTARDMSSAFSTMSQGARGPVRSNAVPVRTIVFHGDADKTVNPINGHQVLDQVRGSDLLRLEVTHGVSADGMRYTRTTETDTEGGLRLEQWVLHGAGHAWSGGSANGSYTDPRGPDASAEMVRFFFQSDRHP